MTPFQKELFKEYDFLVWVAVMIILCSIFLETILK